MKRDVTIGMYIFVAFYLLIYVGIICFEYLYGFSTSNILAWEILLMYFVKVIIHIVFAFS